MPTARAGDVNFDGDVNVIDVITIISDILIKLPEELNDILCYSDLNSDGMFFSPLNQALDARKQKVCVSPENSNVHTA